MNKIIVGMGEALWDVLPEGKKIGGAPANFAYHVSQFGFDSRVVSAVGCDADGQEILDVFAQKKLTCEIEQVDYPTGTVQVTLDAVGVPCYEIKEGVAWDNIPFTDDLKRLALSTRAVCFGSLAQRSPVSRATIQRFLDTMPDVEQTTVAYIIRDHVRIISPLDTILKHTDEGRTKLQLKEIQNNAVELKELVDQLSEGVLSPLSPAENELALEELLMNMRQLLEQQEKRKEQLKATPEAVSDNSLLSAADELFLRKALKFVEQNLDNPEYSVEVLSRDMGMDRTGLYRKLVSVVGKTPTNFIRSIRLKRAAQLLEEGHTVAEVADRVGFSTSSYLSKCFQEEFGMRPLQYVNSLKEQPK